jgi:polyisoprenoid-binding protein YceI
MSIEPGTYELGPESGTLSVHTGKTGAASKAGHNLTIEVQRWNATLQLAADPTETQLRLTADSRSLKVLDGTGGMTHLSDDDKQSIAHTIDDEVLKGTPIEFRSTAVSGGDGDGGIEVRGNLTLWGKTGEVRFQLKLAEGAITGEATFQQTAFGHKPYSALFGTLKVADEIRVAVDARVNAAA